MVAAINFGVAIILQIGVRANKVVFDDTIVALQVARSLKIVTACNVGAYGAIKDGGALGAHGGCVIFVAALRFPGEVNGGE
jgi:hypothetical protein